MDKLSADSINLHGLGKGMKRISRFGSCCFTSLVLLLSVNPSSAQFLYVANGTGASHSTILGYSLTSDGAIKPVPGSPFQTQANLIDQLMPDHNGKHLYAPLDDSIMAFEIATNGSLISVKGSPFKPTHGGPIEGLGLVGIDPDNKYLFSSTAVWPYFLMVWEIRGDGQLNQLPLGATIGAIPAGFGFASKGDANYIFVAEFNNPSIVAYCLNSEGQFSQIPEPSVQINTPSRAVVTPDNNFLLVGSAGAIYSYRISDDGSLTPALNSPLQTDSYGYNEFQVDALSRFLFVQTLSPDPSVPSVDLVYKIGSDGALTLVPGVSLPGDLFAADPHEEYLYLATLTQGTISGYKIGSNGVPQVVPGSPFNNGASYTASLTLTWH
jgi:6-phosphogluconolactonase